MRRLQSRFRDAQQISRGKFDRLPCATAGFTTSALDGYGLRDHWPARPTPYASNPILVHRLACLLHASFRPHLTMTPLRFAITSPPSGCEKDFHLRAVEHARHTNKKPPACAGGSCSCSRVAVYRLAWRLAPPLGPLLGPLPRTSPLETSLTQSSPLPL